MLHILEIQTVFGRVGKKSFVRVGMGRVEGKTAVITAAGQGIGRARLYDDDDYDDDDNDNDYDDDNDDDDEDDQDNDVLLSAP